MNKYLAGVGTALIFRGDNLIGVAKTLTESTYDFSITAEDIRGGAGNALWGQYFHDSNLSVTLNDAMFNLEYIAASLGTTVNQGGLSVKEEQLSSAVGGSVTVTETPVAYDGTMIGWYKKPTDSAWSIGTLEGNTMAIPSAQANEVYCVKYFWQNPDAQSITIKTQYVPAELHVVIINDLYSGDIAKVATEANRLGRLIVDIPRLQMAGNQNLALTASGAATTSLTGSALAVSAGDTCEEDPYYGTMTEEIFGAKWQDNVVAIAIENSEMELANGEQESAIVRVVYRGSMPSERKDASNFTFVSSADSVAEVNNEGVVTAMGTGEAIISVTLTGSNVDAGLIKVTVA